MDLDRICDIQDWYLTGGCNWILNLSSNTVYATLKNVLNVHVH
jgi:hypothetical protein